MVPICFFLNFSGCGPSLLVVFFCVYYKKKKTVLIVHSFPLQLSKPRVSICLVLALLGMSVSGRIVFPNYAIMVALACVGGACTAEETKPPSPTIQQCNCPPSINLAIDGTAREMSLCNNATFDWLVHTLLAQIAIEKEQVAEKTTYIKTLAERMHIDTDEVIILVFLIFFVF